MLGARLKEYRLKKGLKLRQLAEQIGYSQGGLSDIENGKASPSTETLLKIIQNTDINLGWLFTGEGDMDAPGILQTKNGYMCLDQTSVDIVNQLQLIDEPSRRAVLDIMQAGQKKGGVIHKQVDAHAREISHPSSECGRVVNVYVLAGAGRPKDLTEHEPIATLNIPEDFYAPSIVPVKVRGRSMEPIIRDGAFIGVDRAERQVISGEVYAIWMPHEGAVVKRLYMDFDKVIIRSDNKDFEPMTIPYNELESGAYGDDFILGRVKWVIQHL